MSRPTSLASSYCRNGRTLSPREIDDAHVRDVEDAGGAAHGVVLADLRAVLDGHVPAAEIDEAGAQLVVKVVKRSASSHCGSPVTARVRPDTRKRRGGTHAEQRVCLPPLCPVT